MDAQQLPMNFSEVADDIKSHIQELKAELARKKTNIWGARAGARTRAGGARGGCVQHLQGLKTLEESSRWGQARCWRHK